ncbi:hypothetical protein [Exiguobacterium aurantiacum]|uniref:DUF4367 domain-containing protein n=1 Tax=Exiguobacterium aurantiacum TaxID=33987 RepID=A0ABY5FKL1_9BACL|nr:hypothetical protein [Exiguobacterium aurantiacum]UTT42067.1 hypothetical protein NMQ00_10930 [Exiguobacterium aurantiacum]
MRRIGIVLGLAVIGLSGCVAERAEPTESKITVSVNKEEIDSTVSDVEETTAKEVFGSMIEDVPKGTTRLLDAVTAQYTLQYTDGTSERPSRDGVIYETVIDDLGLIAIKLPNRDDSFGVFNYSRDEEWALHGIQNVTIPETAEKVRHGLDLPEEELFVTHFEMNQLERPVEMWTLYDETQRITILSTDAFSVADGELIERRDVSNERYRLDQPEGRGLFYVDQGKLIVLTGDVSEEVLLNLSDSLPEASSADFPLKNQE